MFVACPTSSRRAPSGLPIVEIRPPSPREASEAAALRRAGEQLDADMAAAERAGVELDASLRDFADMTEVERAELRFALRCDPDVQALLSQPIS